MSYVMVVVLIVSDEKVVASEASFPSPSPTLSSTESSPKRISIGWQKIVALAGTSAASVVSSRCRANASACNTPSPMRPLSKTSNTMRSASRSISGLAPSGLRPNFGSKPGL